MCTVSFVKVEGKVIITSNRDERVLRPSAEPPKMYHLNNKKLIFPKDPQAGGTWFAVGVNGTVLVLLNGANEKHIVSGPYRLSRGLIVLDIISHVSPKDFWDEIDLDNIEPFTIVLFQNEALYQLRWNALAKEKIVLDTTKKHIWSSSPLYSAAIRKEREVLFYAALQNKAAIDEQAMYQFHRYTDIEDVENGLVINRDNNLKTLSITQTVIEDNKVNVLYYDLITQQDYATSFLIENK
jgi:uncharacterized protein with NRDE domain